MLIDFEISEKIRNAIGIHFYSDVTVNGDGIIAYPSVVYSGTLFSESNLGGYSYIAPSCDASKVVIGNYTSIARGFINGLGHPKDLLTSSPVAWRTWIPECNFPGRINYEYEFSSIGSDVWIGANVILKAGVTIGDGCIIGAGSMVTRDIPPYSVAVGNPCKVIRSRFNKDVIERIQRLRWFDYDWRNQPIDWREPEISLDAMEEEIAKGFNDKFQNFRYSADDKNIKFERFIW